jgi:undecaprenyl diphosphate synthase
MIEFIKKIYEKRLERRLLSGKIPRHIMIIADGDFVDDGLNKFLRWCEKFKIKEITVCVKGKEKSVQRKSFGSVNVNLIVGYDGKEEITDAVRALARLIEEGKLNPEDVSEKDIERFLKIKSSPDLIVRAGEVIPEFLIWQNIYSELYFIDIDWKSFRYVDFLRCLREYQRRERRYGR